MESNPTNSEGKNGISRATYLAKNETGIYFPRARTALLIIDPVNDFLSVGGAAWEMTKTTVEKNDVVANLKSLTEDARVRNLSSVCAEGYDKRIKIENPDDNIVSCNSL